ncbi:hypothetical protein LKL35_33395 [Streptomyces sp. ET3-23]|uniref:hypothetical protein n=1 Tax=Streptomyces sp. ET3-23 TaxID=2885643 RepID=UPI001D11941F|nr:hypothetical protein [Streptomyces sp. ET3-23]MCC2280278.1 hypothetical protein [Streptomyces sp. ET3-23]
MRVRYGYQAGDGSLWNVYVSWCEIDGEAVPVGIEILSYVRAPDGARYPLPTGLQPLTARLMRELKYGEIADGTRRHLAALAHAAACPCCPCPEAVPKVERERLASFEAVLKGRRKRPGRRPDPDRDDEFLVHFADLYGQALRRGGECAKAPWRCVVEELGREGVQGSGPNGEITPDQVRHWRRRAVARGFLKPGRGAPEP